MGLVLAEEGLVVAPVLRGRRVAELRHAAGLTQTQLADGVGVALQARISQWERGVEQPSARFVAALADALHVTPLEILNVDISDPPLSALRLAAGLSMADVVRIAGIPYATYNRIENGKVRSEPAAELLISLASALSVTTECVRLSISRARRDHESHRIGVE